MKCSLNILAIQYHGAIFRNLLYEPMTFENRRKAIWFNIAAFTRDSKCIFSQGKLSEHLHCTIQILSHYCKIRKPKCIVQIKVVKLYILCLTEFGNNCHSSFIIEDLERKSWTHTHSIFMSLDYLNKSDSMHWIKH